MPPLKNTRQEVFCLGLVTHGNRALAYRDAGYTAKTWKDGSCSADAAICQLLRNKKVAQRIAELQALATRTMVIDKARVLHELARIGFSDVRPMLGDDGAIKDPSQWGDDQAAAVAGIEVFKEYQGTGKQREFIGYTQKLKLWDKNTALLNLAKHLRLLGDEPRGGDTYNLTQYNIHLPAKQTEVVPHEPGSRNGHG